MNVDDDVFAPAYEREHESESESVGESVVREVTSPRQGFEPEERNSKIVNLNLSSTMSSTRKRARSALPYSVTCVSSDLNGTRHANFLNENVSASANVNDVSPYAFAFVKTDVSVSASVSEMVLSLLELRREVRENERERGVLRPGAGSKWALHIQRCAVAPDLNLVGLVPREAPHPPH